MESFLLISFMSRITLAFYWSLLGSDSLTLSWFGMFRYLISIKGFIMMRSFFKVFPFMALKSCSLLDLCYNDRCDADFLIIFLGFLKMNWPSGSSPCPGSSFSFFSSSDISLFYSDPLHSGLIRRSFYSFFATITNKDKVEYISYQVSSLEFDHNCIALTI